MCDSALLHGDDMDRIARSLLVFWALVIGIGLSAPAHAQGYAGLLPEPIGLSELGVWLATRVMPPLTDREREEVLRAHDDYRQAYRALADGELEAAAVASGREQATDPASRAAARRMVTASTARIAALDEALFDAIAVQFEGDRRLGFETIRHARSIQRLLSTESRFSLGFSPMMAQLVREPRMLTPEERVAIEPRLRDAEPRFDTLSRQVVESTARFNAALGRRLEVHAAQGISQQEAYELSRAEAESELGDWLLPMRRLIDASNQLRKELEGMISFDAQRELSRRLLSSERHPFHQSGSSFEPSVRAYLRSAKDPAQHADVETIYRRWAKDDEAYIAQTLELASDPAKARQLYGELQTYREARDEIARNAEQAVTALLDQAAQEKFYGDGVYADSFDPSMDHSGPAPEELPLLRHVASEGLSANSDDQQRYRMDWRPRSMDASAVFAWFGAFTPDERVTIETVVRDAAERWSKEIAPVFEEIDKRWNAIATQLMDADRELRGQPAPELSEFLAHAETRIAALDQAVAFDAAVFDGLAVVLGPADALEVALARCERLVEVWADGESLLSVPWSHELLPNLPRLLRTDTPPAFRAAAEETVLANAANLATICRDRRCTRLRREGEQTWSSYLELVLQKAMQARAKAAEAAAAAQNPPTVAKPADLVPDESMFLRQKTLLSDLTRECAVHTAAWRDVFRSMLDGIDAHTDDHAKGGLPDSDRLSLRIAYERAVWPNRFRDIRSPDPLFRAALALDSLDGERRAAVDALQRSSREQLHRWALAALDTLRATPVDPEKPYDERHQRREARFRCDRAEFDARAVWGLRALLTPAERSQVRSLNEYDLLCTRIGNSWWLE